MTKTLAVLQRRITQRLSGRTLRRRTGNLAARWFRQIRASHDFIEGVAATDVKYGPIHEYGGDIVPKSARSLWIPVGEALTSAGVPRISPREAYPQVNIFRSPKSGKIIAMRKTDGEVLFVLRERVHIPARPYIRPSLKETIPDMKRIFNKELGDAWARA